MSTTPPASIAEALDSMRQSKWFPLLFSAWFTERVYREEISDYRDRLLVDKDENKVVKAARSAARKLKKAIAAAEVKDKSAAVEKFGETGVAFYVDLNSHQPNDTTRTSLPFGHYWFMIEGAAWGAKGVEWRIKVVREVFQGDKTQAERCMHCGKYPDGDSANSTFNTTGSGNGGGGGCDDPLNMTEIAQRLHRTLRENIRPAEWLEDIRPYLTASNAANAVKFVCVLLVAAVAGLARLLPRMLELFNKTIHESAFLVRTATPMFLSVVDMFNKIVGGFYMLLAMMWRDFRRPQPRVPQRGVDAAAGRYLEPPPEYPYRRQHVQRPYLRDQ